VLRRRDPSIVIIEAPQQISGFFRVGRHPAQRLALASNFSDLFNRWPKTWRILRLSALKAARRSATVARRYRCASDYAMRSIMNGSVRSLRTVAAQHTATSTPSCAHNLAGSPSRLAETGLLTSRRRMRLVPSRQKNISSTISRSSFLASGPKARGTGVWGERRRALRVRWPGSGLWQGLVRSRPAHL
jgi:hypothetical protein